MKGPEFGHGLLTSPSTRRAGVVTIADIAPTITGFFATRSPLGMSGRPMHKVACDDTVETLLKLNLNAS